MDKEFVLYAEALELKELGFDEPCFGFFVGLGDNKENPFTLMRIPSEKGQFKWVDNAFHTPTYSQAFRWFREKYKLSGTPHYFTNGFYCYTINDMKNSKKSNRLFTEFETYEEAELACLRKLIEIVKNATKE
jgi:hypothetical protein